MGINSNDKIVPVSSRKLFYWRISWNGTFCVMIQISLKHFPSIENKSTWISKSLGGEYVTKHLNQW